MECPTKLFYTGKDKVYANENIEDSFLAALAEGGFQVGELAKAYFPGGHEVETLDYDTALAETNELLQQKNVIIYEAAVCWQNLFIRTDILVKKGAQLELIEVKAKSYDADEDGEFLGKQGGIASGWKPYLLDIAFQKHVLTQAFPNFKVNAFLMLADKSTVCPTDGLHQKFRVETGYDGRKRAMITAQLTQAELKQQILCRVNVDKICELVYSSEMDAAIGPDSFYERVKWMAEHYQSDQKIVCQPSVACVSCEFRATDEEEARGLKSGFKECWKHTLKWTDQQFDIPTVLDIWNYRGKAGLLAEGRGAMSDVTEEDIDPTEDGRPGLSPSQRRWLQVQGVLRGDNSVHVETAELRREMKQWKFPLHFIDFETTRVAIPFNTGRKPYELVAFQFSHHVVHKNGNIEHKGQYLNTERGFFPNYDFVRALKKELEGDDGSIFRYATHENSTLTAISRQLEENSNPPKDKAELKKFIRSITTSTGDGADGWSGARTMIDLCEMVKRYYYAPATNGSNSIKAVLPAVLNESEYLKKKYSQPIYGTKDGIPSLNFKDKVWIKMNRGQVIDPYKQLPKMFQGVSDRDFALLSHEDELRDGGAAMTAYARMQFEEMTDRERQEIQQALLRYCELDTLAMVMIYEAWANLA
jgi:hypothetical protein